jgi:hypothetical protein
VLDNDLPVMVMDDAPTEANTGEAFLFMVEVEDNIEVVSVSVEYWFGEGSSDNVTMDEWSEDVWRVAVNIPEDDLTSLHYQYWISDSSGNAVKGPETTVEVKDIILPSILSDRTSDKAFTGSSYKFNLQVTDNIDVEEVWVEYWFEGGERSNLTAVEGEDLFWELDIEIPHKLDDLKFIYHIKDSSGNWFTSVEGSTDIEDNVRPVFLNDDTPSFITTGEDLVFLIQVADNIKTGIVTLEYWFGYGEHSNMSMTGAIDYSFTLSVPGDETEDVHYYFAAVDSSQNWNRTERRTVDLIDDDPPEITGDNTPSSAQGGTKLTFSVYFEDNIGMVSVIVEYWVDNGEHTNTTMMGSEPYRLIIDLPEEGGILHYRFHGTDRTGNVISSDVKEIEVSSKDGKPPSSDDDDDDITPAEEDSIPSWGWFLIVIVMLLIILTVVNILITMMRRKGSNAHGNGPIPEQSWGQPTGQQQYEQYPFNPQQGIPLDQPAEGYYPEPSPGAQAAYETAPHDQSNVNSEGETPAYEQEVQHPVMEQEIRGVEQPPVPLEPVEGSQEINEAEISTSEEVGDQGSDPLIPDQ